MWLLLWCTNNNYKDAQTTHKHPIQGDKESRTCIKNRIWKDFGAPKLKFGFTGQKIRFWIRRRLMCFVYQSNNLLSYDSVFHHWANHFYVYLQTNYLLVLHAWIKLARECCFFFILLVAQLVPGQTRFLPDPICYTHP